MLRDIEDREDTSVMVTYQFEIDDETWAEWKNTVLRSKSLDTRLIELIEADTEGRVDDETTDDTQARESAHAGREPDAEPDAQEPQPAEEEREIAQGQLLAKMPGRTDRDVEARVNAVLAMYDHLRKRPGEDVHKDDLLDLVDADAVSYGSVGSFWSNAVKKSGDRPNTLLSLPGVERGSEQGEYRYVAERE